MAKKKIEVDEDMLKEIMAGDIPIFGRTKQKENAPPPAEPKTVEVVETPPEEKPPVAVQEKATVKPKKRKEDSCDSLKMNLPTSRRLTDCFTTIWIHQATLYQSPKDESEKSRILISKSMSKP